MFPDLKNFTTKKLKLIQEEKSIPSNNRKLFFMIYKVAYRPDNSDLTLPKVANTKVRTTFQADSIQGTSIFTLQEQPVRGTQDR